MVLEKIGDYVKKGFTLVELLGVFSIMAAVLLLSIPAVTNILTKSKESQYTSYKQDIYLATEAYVSSHRDLFLELKETDKLSYVRISTLLSSNYLKSTMINPLTNKKVMEEANNVVTVYMDAKGIYVYNYITEVTEAETLAINDYEEYEKNPTSVGKIEIIETVNNLVDSDIKLALLNKLGE